MSRQPERIGGMRLSVGSIWIGRSGRAVLVSLVTITLASGIPARAAEEKKSSTVTATATTAATPAHSAAGMPSDEEMMKIMMEMGKLNENHKLLASLDGTWSYVVKMWMDGNTSAKPLESTGTAVRKSIMDGRYIELEAKGKMEMPGPDGKPQAHDFVGMGLEGYDNAKQKFFSTWMDSMGTGMMMADGTYDAASKTFTYTGEYAMMPGVLQKIREVVKVVDNDHMLLEWFEDRDGKDVKTMEINYTRRK